VDVPRDEFDLFEQMHYDCFHYEFEDPADSNAECAPDGCGSAALIPPERRSEGLEESAAEHLADVVGVRGMRPSPSLTAGLAQRCGKRLPGVSRDAQRHTVPVGGVANQDHALCAGGLDAVAPVAIAVSGLAPVAHSLASLSISASDSDTR